jgi:predicted dehydrogenase
VVAGNFGFSMNGTHYFEAFRFLADEVPVEITAWFSAGTVPNPRGPQFQDHAGSIRAITASGKRLYMEIGADQGHGVRAIYACRNGMITINELTGEWVSTVREEQYRDLPTTRYGMPSVNAQRIIQPADVVLSSAAVLDALVHEMNCVSGEDGRRVVELLVAAYRSAEHGNVPMRLDGNLDRNRVFPWA